MIGALRAILSLETAAFEKGARQAQGSLSGLQRRMEGFGKTATALGAKMSVISGAMAAVGAAGFALSKSAADVGNRIDKSSKAVGLSASAYQELGFAIGQVSEISEGQLNVALRKMNTRLGQATQGSKPMIDAFTAIGISAEDLASGTVTTESAFAALTAAMQNVKDPATAAALAGRVLGEEAAALGPILMESGGNIDELRKKARALGIVMSDDAVAASAAFTDKLDELTRQFGAVKDRLGVALMPVMISFMQTIQDKVIPAVEALIGAGARLVEWFGALPGPIQEAAAIIATALGIGGPVILAIGALSTALAGLIAATGPVGLFIAAAAVLTAAWIRWGDDIKAAVGGAIDWITTKFNEFLAFVEAIPAKMIEIGQNMIQGLIDGITAKWEALKAKVLELADLLPNWMKDALDIQSPSRVFREIGQFITEGLALGIADNAPMAESAIGEVAEKVAGQTGSLESGLRSVASTAESAFTGLVTGAMSFNDAISKVLSSLAQMFAQSAFRSIGSAIGFADGAAFASGRVTAFASGGVVNAATMFPMRSGMGLMGESGPEAIMPLTRVGGKLGVMAQGATRASVELIVRQEPGTVAEIARSEAADVVRAGLDEYDRKVLPASVDRHNRDRRRVR